MLNHLAKFVNENPDIQEAWVNLKGEWVFAENVRFPTRLSREEILEHLQDEDTEDVTAEEYEAEITELSKELNALKAENEKLKASVPKK